jgi:hypothetical protein
MPSRAWYSSDLWPASKPPQPGSVHPPVIRTEPSESSVARCTARGWDSRKVPGSAAFVPEPSGDPDGGEQERTTTTVAKRTASRRPMPVRLAQTEP